MSRIKSLVIVGLMAGLLMSMATVGKSQSRRRRLLPEPGALKVGQFAPTFALKSIDAKESFDLKAFHDVKPVVLFFGSYT